MKKFSILIFDMLLFIRPLFKSIGLIAALALSLTLSISSYAAIDVYEFDKPSQEQQYRRLIEEFRCPKCQNQNLAGSDSQISQDLKRKTYQLVLQGQSDQQIREYMHERYGDFISYKPPIRPSTWILWFFPPLFLTILIGWWLWRNAKLNKRPHTGINHGDQPVALPPDQYTEKFNTNGINHSADDNHDQSQTYTLKDNKTEESNTADSGLSATEQAKLKALINQHGNNE